MDALQLHTENTEELQVQLEEHRDWSKKQKAPLLLVDDEDNSKKYVMTDVRYDGENIVVAIARL
jgi:hypothetical protein